MKTPSLVQRCSVQTRKPSEIVGVDSFLNYAYMGSAEFEFGQLNRNLNAILPHLDEYQIISTDLKCQTKEGIFLLCTKEQIEIALTWVKQEAIQNNKGLKERTELHRNLSGAASDVDVWWVLEDSWPFDEKPNHQNIWFFCKGKETARLLLSALKKTKEKLSKKE